MKKSVKFATVRSLTLVGALISLGVVFELLIAFPVFPPPVNFLLISPGDLPILFLGYFFGPFAGILGSAVKALLFILFRPDGNGLWGAAMSFIASGAFVGSFAVIARKKSKLSLWLGLGVGILARAGIMIPANLIITPTFLHVPLQVVKNMLIPFLIPFNLLHSGLNSILFLVLLPRLKSFFNTFTKKPNS